MTDAHAAAASVKSVAEGAAAWLPLVQTLAGGVIAGGVALYVNHRSHKNALEREEKAAAVRLRNERQAAEEKLARERYFIATELVFMLETFAEGCARVATDDGEDDLHGERKTTTEYPVLAFTGVEGDWRALSELLMFRIREIPVLQDEARRMIAGTGEYDSPPDYKWSFQERQYQYARLGLKAIIQARCLRKSAGLPDTRLDATKWSAQPAMWTVWRRERRRRAADAIRSAQFDKIVNAEDDAEPASKSDGQHRVAGVES